MNNIRGRSLQDWEMGPLIVYGLAFWNRKSLRAMLSHLSGDLIFCSSFKRAMKQAKRHDASILAWAARLTDEQRAQVQAAGISLINMEDGFVRSVGLGAAFVPAVSLIMDRLGIYYDPSMPSELEELLQTADLSEQQRQRGSDIRQLLVERGVTKYNIGRHFDVANLSDSKTTILVPGQVSDDASILKTRSDSLDLGSDINPNLMLLKRVRADNPGAFIIFKPHPDVTSGLRSGGLAHDVALSYADRVETDVDIIKLIEACDRLETISSLSGFEALIRGVPVTVHGQPFYAGWGLTKDHTQNQRRSRKRTIDELVFLTLVAYSTYVSPSSFEKVEIEDVVQELTVLRQAYRVGVRDYVNLWIAKVAYKLGL